jgi:hypothetical protein
MRVCVFVFAVSGAAAVSSSSISSSRRRGVLGLQIEASAPYRVLNISELMNEHGNIINDAVNIAGKPKFPLPSKPPQLSSTQHSPSSSQSHTGIPISTAALLQMKKCCSQGSLISA